MGARKSVAVVGPFLYPKMKRKSIDKILYLKNGSLLTNSEKKFYSVLEESLQDNFYLFSKVRIADIVHIPEWYKPYHWAIYWWNRIKSKHVDFLICTKILLSHCLLSR